tara:strand:- start:670 stop:876 length:207 start_codon:yes stop_codon:yes gene_type:complete
MAGIILNINFLIKQMINYIVYIVIILILVLVSSIAVKAVNRGIEAKQRLKEDQSDGKYESKKNNNDKN